MPGTKQQVDNIIEKLRRPCAELDNAKDSAAAIKAARKLADLLTHIAEAHASATKGSR